MLGASRGNSVIKATPGADHRTKRGQFVIVSSAGVANISATAASDIPHGVITDGENTDGQDSSPAFSFGCLHATDGTVSDDAGTGARVRVCLFLESGVTDELVDAILIQPAVLS
jgi:hypothetical protein